MLSPIEVPSKSSTKLYLFDVDGTLTPPRGQASQDFLALLTSLRDYAHLGVIGGSTLSKIRWQLGDDVLDRFDFVFSECGLNAFNSGRHISMGETFISFLGEEKYKALVNFILHYIADLNLPIKRGTFVEFRDGLINVCPQGHDTTSQEQADFEAYDNMYKIRETMIQALKAEFPHFNLVCAIGGRTSFDMFPKGWDKTYALRFLEEFSEILYFGDKFQTGGNDHEMFQCEKVKGIAVKGPEHTESLVKKIVQTHMNPIN